MDKEEVQYFKEAALYALSLDTPREVIQYGEIVYAEDDNFEGAEGFRQALEATEGKTFNCRVIIPNGFDIKPTFTDEDYFNDEDYE